MCVFFLLLEYKLSIVITLYLHDVPLAYYKCQYLLNEMNVYIFIFKSDPFPPRLNLPKRKKKVDREDEEQDTSMKNDTSSEQLDVDGDSSSEVSSEINFNYEYAQMEVTMKALANNGEQICCAF